MEKIAEEIVNGLIKRQYIESLEKDDYVYATIMLMEKWISLSITLIRETHSQNLWCIPYKD